MGILRNTAKFILVATLAILTLPSCDSDTKEEGDSGIVIKVMLHANDAGGQTREIEAYKGRILEEPVWRPTGKTDYTFAGWFSDKNATIPFDFENTIIEGALDLYAGYVPDIILKETKKVARVTGETQSSDASLPNPNHTQTNWNVGGTDLGIIWEMSKGGYGVAFGDTFNTYSMGGDWRSNVIGFSDNTDLDNGLKFYGMMVDEGRPNRAKPIMERENYYNFTYIPTAAISLNGKDYVHIMYWQVGGGLVEKDYSAYWVSGDGCKTWSRGSLQFAADSYFGMVGLAKRPGDEYCYMIGTKTGQWGANADGYRKSPAKLARFKHSDILDKSKYEFWNGGKRKWVVGKEQEATTIIDGTIGELGVIWLEDAQRWLVMYFNEAKYAICYRSAAMITGPWSTERKLCDGRATGYNQLYGSYPHPASSKGDYIYWNMSLWGPYNVFFMRSEIDYAN
ncbi:MAG: DUF4185 domain-containing protein [Bacteroidales bacterium]|nr:DUF4185 domain-containing protein [Bacteroidales bacterium]